MRKVTIIGAGPGNPDLLSRAALDAIDIADVVIGAHRALAGIDVPPDVVRCELVKTADIVAALTDAASWQRAVVVMTGDVGLFSGARRLVEALSGDAQVDVRVIPGISSASYLAARLARPWQDWRFASAHGVACDIVAEAERMTHEPDFKGYIHDIGGPTANFRFPSCREQMLRGMCNGGKHCLAPTTCSHMIVDHSDYLKILRRVRELPGVKKVFIRSGIRFDYLMADPDDTFFKELVEYHVSGQLKVAPEHCAPNTLAYMGKPPIETFNKFKDKFYELSKKAGKKQYLVPYLMSSHPGSTLKDAVYLAEYLYKNHMRPEQVQDFYPTPGTVSTCMFYTGLDPYTLKPVFVEKTPEGKALQRALLQYYEPRNAEKVVKALQLTHREDLIPLLVPAVGRRAVQRTARRASGLRDRL